MKLWVDLRSKDGQIFALIGLLEGPNNRHVFTAAGQSVIFGGFEISSHDSHLIRCSCIRNETAWVDRHRVQGWRSQLHRDDDGPV